MNLDLQSLFPDFEALTPDGRWNALQQWLKENPEYGECVEEWSTQSVEQVFGDICILATAKYGALAGMAIVYPPVQAKIKKAIEAIQALYKERKAQDVQPQQLKAKKKRRKKAQ